MFVTSVKRYFFACELKTQNGLMRLFVTILDLHLFWLKKVVDWVSVR